MAHRNSVCFLNTLLKVDLVLVDESEQLRTPLVEKPGLPVDVRDRVLWDWHLTHLLKLIRLRI